jgi:DNA invertase Pin-like site-specific DNA recombinase
MVLQVVSQGYRTRQQVLDRIMEDLERRGVALWVLSMGGQEIDTRGPTGRVMLTMLGAVAEFERTLSRPKCCG